MVSDSPKGYGVFMSLHHLLLQDTLLFNRKKHFSLLVKQLNFLNVKLRLNKNNPDHFSSIRLLAVK